MDKVWTALEKMWISGRDEAGKGQREEGDEGGGEWIFDIMENGGLFARPGPSSLLSILPEP